jgi:hypothetical protein
MLRRVVSYILTDVTEMPTASVTHLKAYCVKLGAHFTPPTSVLNTIFFISGSIVSDYGLDDRAIGVRSPAGAKDFSSILYVQTGSGVHPASSPMGTGGPFPGGKARPGA